ncbi:MAG: type IV toxin-antitoxin system AbiEi family antitoxin domain-containing protein, partial [Eubacterium sp.]|nr:type IV toxin-antitoxin system AbiEi family antitoxin domain-containing protein [Eubacterium sp.]
MKYYEEFVKLGCFTFDEAVALVGNDNAALQLLRDYVKKKHIAKVRKGLYVALSMVDGEPVANKFVIASKLSETAAVSHHSAFEYYGYANQVSYEVTVSSKSRFNPFEFNGISYERTAPSILQGINHNAD